MKLWTLCVGLHSNSVKIQLTVSCPCVRQEPLWLNLWCLFVAALKTSSAQCHVTVVIICFGFVHFSVAQMEMSAATGDLETSGRRQRPSTVKRRRWGGLRQQWKLLGLFEIDQQHEFYSLTCMMKEGLAAATQSTIDTAPTVSTGQQRQQFNHLYIRTYMIFELFQLDIQMAVVKCINSQAWLQVPKKIQQNWIQQNCPHCVNSICTCTTWTSLGVLVSLWDVVSLRQQ